MGPEGEPLPHEPLFHELHSIVTSAATLIELHHVDEQPAHPYRLISLCQSREAFAGILSKLVWYATEFLLQRDFLGILRHTLPDIWHLELREAAWQDHKSDHWIPSVTDINMNIKVEYMHTIGQGAFGRVYKAMWLPGESCPCAVKEVDGGNDESFRKEASVLASLHHPNIVTFIGCLEGAALVMELMDYDLTYLMRRFEKVGLDLIVAVDIMLQAAQGMRYLHAADIVHRDLKAANVLIKEVNKFAGTRVGCYSVKLTDFGLARTEVECVEKSWGCKVGTLKWRAPELLEVMSEEGHSNDHHHDMSFSFFPKQADVYSFGILCCEVVTCKAPYSDLENRVGGISRVQLQQKILEGRRPLLPSSGLPQQLVSLIQRCWDRNPDRRPSFNVICLELQQIKACLLTERHIFHRHGLQSTTSFDSTFNQVHEPHQFQHVSYSALRLQTV